MDFLSLTSLFVETLKEWLHNLLKKLWLLRLQAQVVVHKPIVFPYVDTSLKRGLYETVRF